MIRCYKLCNDIPDIAIAPNDLQGDLSARALRHCEPFLVANAAGFLVNSPADVDLTWTGSEILARFEGMEETILVDRLFLPGSANYWNGAVSPHAANVLPPFVEAFPEHGIAQIWSGLFVTTSAGISAWVRGPINREMGSAHHIIEGVVDTDWWAGPLFTVFKFLKTDFPIRLNRSRPMLQIVPVHRELMRVRPEEIEIKLIENAEPDFLVRMVETANRRNSEPPGSYRRLARQRGSSL